jgi:putative FmdB family regulatory protein
MPTYAYECEACKHGLEAEQRISEAPLKKCPGCGKSKLRRMISSGNFILKGGGWYSDGYGSSKGGGSRKDSDSSSSGSSDGGSSSDSGSSSSSSSPSSAPSGST